MKRKCNICGVVKELYKFYHDRTKPEGHAYYCKDCDKLKAKEKYGKNRDKRIKQNMEYQHRHAEEHKQYRHEYYLKKHKKPEE